MPPAVAASTLPALEPPFYVNEPGHLPISGQKLVRRDPAFPPTPRAGHNPDIAHSQVLHADVVLESSDNWFVGHPRNIGGTFALSLGCAAFEHFEVFHAFQEVHEHPLAAVMGL